MTQVEQAEKIPTIGQFINSDKIREATERTLGGRGQQFLTSILTMANSTPAISECEPRSLYNACLTAATLDLPINQNLGFAYIIPYKAKGAALAQAQFQMGYKGFIQLAIRSGKFLRIGVKAVCEGQLVSFDDFSGEPLFDFNSKESDKVVGYMAYFELTNGFRKADYMSIEGLEKHGKKYSQSYKKNFGVWKDNFDAMAKKTVIKLLLSKWAPLSTEMQQAIEEDQKVADDYADNRLSFDVENRAIEGKAIEDVPDEIPSEETYLDEPVEAIATEAPLTDEHPLFNSEDKPAEAQAPRAPQSLIKRAFAIFGELSPETQDVAERGRKQLFGDKSRALYTTAEANKWIGYLESLKETPHE